MYYHKPRGLPWSRNWGETGRVLAYSLAVALAFNALMWFEYAALDHVSCLLPRLIAQSPDPLLLEQANEVAVESRDALERFPPDYKRSALQLGFAVGAASLLSARELLPPAERQASTGLAVDHLMALAHQQAMILGISEVSALPAKNLRAFTEMNDRLEADENGVAAQLHVRVSRVHKHLYLLGAHLGTESVRINSIGVMTQGGFKSFVSRNAALAGLPLDIWSQLVTEPCGETPEQLRLRFRSATQTLEAAVGS